MNRSELVSAIAAKSDVSVTEVDAVLRALTDVVGTALEQREKVVLPGFVTFEAKHREARTGRNPRTGEPLEVAAAWVPKVTAGSGLKAAAARS